MANYQEFIDFRTGSVFKFNTDNVVVDINYDFIDGEPSQDSEYIPKVYPFSYQVIKFTKQTGFAIVIKHWVTAGMVLGCPECSMIQVDSVWVVSDSSFEEANRSMLSFADTHVLDYGSDEEKKLISPNHFYIALDNIDLPVKVQQYFISELRKAKLMDIKVVQID